MDFSKLTLFAAMKKRMDWLTQRQEVLAQNIANADTPKYRARDLQPFEFKELFRRQNAQINMATTRPEHLGGRRRRIRDFSEEIIRRPYETAPAGNSVILEEQMMKVGKNTINHKLTTELYRKHMAMLRSALTKPR